MHKQYEVQDLCSRRLHHRGCFRPGFNALLKPVYRYALKVLKRALFFPRTRFVFSLNPLFNRRLVIFVKQRIYIRMRFEIGQVLKTNYNIIIGTCREDVCVYISSDDRDLSVRVTGDFSVVLKNKRLYYARIFCVLVICYEIFEFVQCSCKFGKIVKIVCGGPWCCCNYL